MAKIRALADPSVLTVRTARTRELTPKTIARRQQYEQMRALVRDLTDERQVFEVELEDGEKPLTVRQRLLRAAVETGKEIAVRRYGKGFAVGLMTPERRDRRGRPRSKGTA